MFSVPEGNYTEALSEIINRHRNYTVAKAKGKLGTNKATISDLREKSNKMSLGDKCSGNCALCLEPMKAGDKVVKLPCGHMFHAGRGETLSSVKVGKKRRHSEDSDSCKGVLYWLENNTSCPQCRFNLPTAIPKPTKSESLLVPLLHRQNRVILRQTDIIKEQQKQIEELKMAIQAKSSTVKTSSKRQKRANSNRFGAQSQIFSNFGSTQTNSSSLAAQSKTAACQQQHSFYLPRLSWQDSTSHTQQETRKRILGRVTAIALQDIVVRGTMDERAKQTRLHELAAKVELILYCCSPSYEVYANLSTLRHRTLSTVRNLAEKARALKSQNGTPGISLQLQH